ncbi:hypothetical protein BBBOND_0405630 [Babesia bigemina]|uniref:Uncharacterized protein n=1 Tax=Babesia bigemina TaxID=5866 RepID=A0A061DBX2_BABBI|nr:hypothetical protein BBBOND_0405630 [Babesia bigemina]CDR98078.1 hypothetical protein BBBOND_0405630 [Babesia bigemina]|eukprot:XP_012770264.1 hypothetical protein BBBOND_0405630 [Babesia bigemina]
MVYTSLTEAPHDLKECIDWLIALRGSDAERHLKAMGAALHKFLVDKPVGKMELPALEEVKLITKEFLERKPIQKQLFVKGLLRIFEEPMNRSGIVFRLFYGQESDCCNIVQQNHLEPYAMGLYLGRVVYGCDRFMKHMKIPDQYKSAYSSDATWEASCAEDPEACAVVLVGIAPMLYAGLRSLKYVTRLALQNEANEKARRRLKTVLRAVGYRRSKRRCNITVSFMSRALSEVDKDVLEIIYDIAGFWAFY